MSTTREKDIAAAVRAGHPAPSDDEMTDADIFADSCAHRDRQVAAYLRARAGRSPSQSHAYELHDLADAIERGEHVRD